MQLAKKMIGQELSVFENYLNQTFQSTIPLLENIMQYLSGKKGKQLRPVFVLLCSRLGGTINERTYRAAALVEMLHTASLVHDDIVDNAMERRGAHSVNALWKSRVAVLTGDVLFTKGVLLSLDNEDYKVLKIFSKAIEQTIAGETVQLAKSRKLNFDEQVYYEIIRQKTATLLSAACEAGAATTFTDDEQVARLGLFGEKLGMAFQIRDDLFDYGTQDVGKPLANDIQEQKTTLPLIYTLRHCSAALRRKLIRIIKHRHSDKKEVRFLIEQVHKAGGMQYAKKQMLAYRHEALDILATFPPSGARDALEELTMYITEREY